jgi:TonB family protein
MLDNKDYKHVQDNKDYVKRSDSPEKGSQNSLNVLMVVVLGLIVFFILLLFLDGMREPVSEAPFEKPKQEQLSPAEDTVKKQPFEKKPSELAQSPSAKSYNNSETAANKQPEPDFGPYMKNLQRRIKHNWNPPRGNNSKRVVVHFKVDKYGKLLKLQIAQSSGQPESDSAAIQAVKDSAPFQPLPVEYTGKDVDIEFTFDYNVFRGRDKL